MGIKRRQDQHREQPTLLSPDFFQPYPDEAVSSNKDIKKPRLMQEADDEASTIDVVAITLLSLRRTRVSKNDSSTAAPTPDAPLSNAQQAVAASVAFANANLEVPAMNRLLPLPRRTLPLSQVLITASSSLLSSVTDDEESVASAAVPVKRPVGAPFRPLGCAPVMCPPGIATRGCRSLLPPTASPRPQQSMQPPAQRSKNAGPLPFRSTAAAHRQLRGPLPQGLPILRAPRLPTGIVARSSSRKP